MYDFWPSADDMITPWNASYCAEPYTTTNGNMQAGSGGVDVCCSYTLFVLVNRYTIKGFHTRKVFTFSPNIVLLGWLEIVVKWGNISSPNSILFIWIEWSNTASHKTRNEVTPTHNPVKSNPEWLEQFQSIHKQLLQKAVVIYFITKLCWNFFCQLLESSGNLVPRFRYFLQLCWPCPVWFSLSEYTLKLDIPSLYFELRKVRILHFINFIK